jgi:hypothetical protein
MDGMRANSPDQVGGKPEMKNLLKFVLVLFCATAAALSLLGLVLCGVSKMELNTIVQKMNSEMALYIFPAFVLFEFYFLINDFLAHFSKKYQLPFGFDFSEFRFTYDLDNNNTPIPLKAKLLQLYPLSIALTLLGFVLVLITR